MIYSYREYLILDKDGYWYIHDIENNDISLNFGAQCYATDREAEKAIDFCLNRYSIFDIAKDYNGLALKVKSTTLHNLKTKHNYFNNNYVYVLRNKYNNTCYASKRGTVYELNSPDILIFRDEEIAYKTKNARTNGHIYKVVKVWYSKGRLGK